LFNFLYSFARNPLALKNTTQQRITLKVTEEGINVENVGRPLVGLLGRNI
jgi:hypothetical protein